MFLQARSCVYDACEVIADMCGAWHRSPKPDARKRAHVKLGPKLHITTGMLQPAHHAGDVKQVCMTTCT